MVNIQDMQCGKMSVEPSPQIKEKTSKVSSRNSVRSRPRKLISLNQINGKMQVKCWEITTQLPGESLMRNIGEYASEENESFLSQILMEEEHPKYYFTQSKKEGQGTTGDTSKSSRETSNICLNDQGGSRMDVTKGVTATLRAKSNHPPLVFDNHGRDARIKGPVDVAQTVVSLYGTGGN